MNTEKENLLLLDKYINLETGRYRRTAFTEVDSLFLRSIQFRALNRKIQKCRKCPGLNSPAFTESAPGFGNPNARIFFVGQSLCTQCMVTQIPFTEGSGYYIDAVLAIIGMTRLDVFISNILHCHPPGNRQSTPDEIKNCMPYLKQELEIVKPAIVVALGNDAKRAIEEYKLLINIDCKLHGIKHPASYLHSYNEGIIDWVLKLSNVLEKYNGTL